jgi:hypothetical protein
MTGMLASGDLHAPGAPHGLRIENLESTIVAATFERLSNLNLEDA